MQCADCQGWPCKHPKRVLDDCCACSGEVCGDAACPAIELVVCEVCGRGDREDELLLCDGCDHACHLFCMRPPARSIPPVWFCQRCQTVALQKRSRNSDGAGSEIRTSMDAYNSAAAQAGAQNGEAQWRAVWRRRHGDGRSGQQGTAPEINKFLGTVDGVDEEFMRRLDERKVKLCNCRKSRCLKQYCDCFREREFCSPRCNCTGCLNHPGGGDVFGIC